MKVFKISADYSTIMYVVAAHTEEEAMNVFHSTLSNPLIERVEVLPEVYAEGEPRVLIRFIV